MCAEIAHSRSSRRRAGIGVRGARRGQGGQALVEVLVVAIALVPLAVLVVLLGKYQTLQSASIAASRSLAFECAAYPAACRAADPLPLVDAVRARHFNGQPLWRDRAGRPLLERLADVGAAVSMQSFDAGAGTAAGNDAGALQLIDSVAGPARFGLSLRDGLFDARIQVVVAPSFASNTGFISLDPMALTLRARTVVLSDTWMASGPAAGPTSVATRVAAGSRLDAVRETGLSAGYQLTRWSIDLMHSVGLEPAGSPGSAQANPDAIPQDRVGQP